MIAEFLIEEAHASPAVPGGWTAARTRDLVQLAKVAVAGAHAGDDDVAVLMSGQGIIGWRPLSPN